jgi:hypothetical protein
MHNNMDKSPGFIKAALIIIVAVAILAASGISVREHLSPDEIASTTEQVAERGENFYTKHVEVPLHTIIFTPATIVWEYIEEYGVGSVTDWLENTMN